MERVVLRPEPALAWSAFLRQIQSAILTRNLLPEGGKILVAVSGGMDSMVLLHALNCLAKAHRWKLTAVHFNHQLRGRASEADERLVRETARFLKLPFVAGRADIRQAARKTKVSLEMAGRAHRHQFLARTARRLHIPIVALAHHADDQVELFFLRVLRGTGGQGLAGMKWSNPSPIDPSILLVRPLLNQPKAALAKAARAAAVPFLEDATNGSLEFERNRVRHELIPFLRKKFQPAITKTVPRVMELAGADAEVVLALARSWLGATRRSPFGHLAVAVQRRVIQLQLFALAQAPDFDLVERLRDNAEESFALNGAEAVWRDRAGLLHLRKMRPPLFDPLRRSIALRIKGRTTFDGLTLDWNVRKMDGADFRPVPNREFFDADKTGAKIGLRHWQPGDRFQPIGCRSPRKLQDLFVNIKVPRARRHCLVVALSSEGEIFWVEGLRVGERFKLEPETVRRLQWQWRRQSE
jgi:tRNA(Ile)-lysidine synthase